MYKQILLPTDGSRWSLKAATHEPLAPERHRAHSKLPVRVLR